MAHDSATPVRSRPDARRFRLQFFVIFTATFVLFLLAALTSRMLPWKWGTNDASAPRKSMIASVWEASGTATRYAFMG
jgi:hypothetical protein